jgi:hypothetical protein
VVRMKTRFMLTSLTVSVARWAPLFVPSIGVEDCVKVASEVMLFAGM